jgi:hypothetical protein
MLSIRGLPTRLRSAKRCIERLFSEANRALQAANAAEARMRSDAFVVNHLLPRMF